MASVVHLVGIWQRKLWERFFVYSVSVDYFNLLNMLGTVFAVHYDAAGPRKLLWTAYRALYLLSYLSYCYKAGWVFVHWEYNTATVNIFGAVGITSGALLRVLLIERYHPTIRRLQRFLNDRAYRSGDRCWDRECRSSLYRQNNRFLVILISAVVLQSLCFLAWLQQARPEFMLQYDGEVIGGPAVQILYGTVTACWGIVYVLSFIVFYTIMAGFRVEMEILVRSFQELEHSLLLEHGQSLRLGFSGTELDELDCWSNFTAKLKERIVRHVTLLEKLRTLRSIVAPFAFLQYYSTFILIADAFFVVSFEGFSGYSLAYVLFACFLIMESFLLSRCVEHLNEQNSRIGVALYELDWPQLLRFSFRFRREYEGIRRTLLVTIMQTQRSLMFNYGAQTEISMNSFSELMEKTYSVLTFMLQLGR